MSCSFWFPPPHHLSSPGDEGRTPSAEHSLSGPPEHPEDPVFPVQHSVLGPSCSLHSFHSLLLAITGKGGRCHEYFLKLKSVYGLGGVGGYPRGPASWPSLQQVRGSPITRAPNSSDGHCQEKKAAENKAGLGWKRHVSLELGLLQGEFLAARQPARPDPSMGCRRSSLHWRGYKQSISGSMNPHFLGKPFQISCHTKRVNCCKLLQFGGSESLSPGRFGCKLLCKTPCNYFRREPSSVQALSTALWEQRAPVDLRSIPTIPEQHHSPSSSFKHAIFKSLKHTE